MATLSSIITPSNVETASSTSTLTNKTISGSSNTITNVPLSTAVTGTLPIANGGTGTSSTTFANLTTNVTGTLPVANGGTGAASLTANNVLLGNGTSAVQVVAPGSSGNVLTSNGTTWASAAPAGGSLILVTTATGSGVDTIEITSGLTSTYNVYKLYVIGELSSSSYVYFRFYINSTLSTSNYGSSYHSYTSSSPTATSISGASAADMGGGKKNIFELTLFGPSAVAYRNAVWAIRSSTNDVNVDCAAGFIYNATTGTSSTRAITGVQATTFGTNGTWSMRLYGVKE